VLYHGLEVLGGGAILGGLVLGAIAVFIIDRELVKAAAFAVAGALLTFFGFMHGEHIGVGQSLPVAGSYLGFTAVLLACAKFAHVEPQPAPHGEPVPGATHDAVRPATV
jgi:AGZA family xanthine/uracil permease-like MFS transporter